MLNRILIIFLLIVGGTNILPAQIEEHDHEDYCFLCADGVHHSNSPYEINIKKELPFIIVGTGLTITSLILRSNQNLETYTQEELDQLDRSDVNSFDRGATYNWNEQAQNASDGLFVATLLLPTLFLINHHTRSDILPILVMGLEVAAINYGITSSIKTLVHRNRPYVYNPDLSYEQRTDGQSRFSYFSGHTSVTASFSFFFAKVMSDYHPLMDTGWKIGMWTFAAAIPAFTGYLRVEGGKHYKTDVFTGYVIGAVTGWLIPHLHRKKSLKSTFSLYPTRVFGTSGIGLTYKF